MLTRWYTGLPYVKPVFNEFIITVKTDNAGVSASNEVLLPIQGTAMVIDWGDGSTSVHTQTNSPNNTVGGNNVTHTYASAGVYQIKISPSISRIVFNNQGDRLKLLEINNWGKAVWTTFASSFFGCINLVLKALDTPNLQSVTTLRLMFENCQTFQDLSENNSLNNWDVSNITEMLRIFRECLIFNSNIGNWDVSKVTNFNFMFAEARDFNNGNSSDINNWQINTNSSVNVTMVEMFSFGGNPNRRLAFNQPLDNWNTSRVSNFSNFIVGTNVYSFSLGSFFLRNDVNITNMLNLSSSTVGVELQEAYSRTLIGWANNIFSRGGVVTGRSLGASNRRYNNINYVSGQQFNNAVDARDYLVNTLGWTITGDAQV